MNTYFVYILYCKDGSYYTGVTNDLERRIHEHDTGLHSTSYTAKRRPLKLVFTEMFNDVNQAIAFERQIKGWSRAKKEALIQGDWNTLIDLSKNRQIKSSTSSD